MSYGTARLPPRRGRMSMAFDYEYEDDESWTRASRRKRIATMSFVTAAVLALVVGIGAILWAFTGAAGPARTPTAAAASPDPSGLDQATGATGAPSDPAESPSAATSPSPSVKASPSPTKKAKTKVKTQPPPKNTPVAPPPPPPPAPGCTPSHFGTDAPKADVRK